MKRALALLSGAAALVVCAAGRIGADHKQVLARGQTLMAGPGRENGHVAC